MRPSPPPGTELCSERLGRDGNTHVMKNIFILLMLIAFNNGAYGQSLTITNHTSCTTPFVVTMYASSTTMNTAANTYLSPCSAGCTEIKSATFSIGSGVTLHWCDPYDFETGTCGCAGCSSMVGWVDVECGNFSGVEGMTCMGPTYWSGCNPSTFAWTYASIDRGCNDCMNNPCLAGQVGILPCASSTFSGSGACTCPSGMYATWSSSSGNVTIDIY
jgi:hypothetical protein